MAYNTKYQIDWYRNGNIDGHIYLNRLDYVGPITNLQLAQDGVNIEYKMSDWFQPIVGQSCTIDIINTSGDFWEYSDLFAVNEREWQIQIYSSVYYVESHMLFEGWMISELTQLEYKNNNPIISISGSNYLSNLDKVTPDFIKNGGDNGSNVSSMFNVLNSCLKSTGSSRDIWLNCYIEPSSSWNIWSENSLLNRCGIDIENFATNTTEFKGATEIIKDILTPIGCYIYPWDNRWYIERYADIWTYDGSKNYKIYNRDTSYGYLDYCTHQVVFEPSIGLCDNDMVKDSANMTINPGLKKLIIKKNLKEYSNYTTSNFSLGTYGTNWTIDASENVVVLTAPRLCQPSNAILPDNFPPLKGWNYYNGTTFGNKKYITPAGGRIQYPTPGWYAYHRGAEYSYKNIGNPIFRIGEPETSGPEWLLASRFQFTSSPTLSDPSILEKQEGTELTIQFKYGPNPMYTPSSTLAQFKDKDLKYEFEWWLRNTHGSRDGGGTDMYIKLVKPTEEESTWYWEERMLGIYTIDQLSNTTVMTSDDLNRMNTMDVEIVVPVGDVSGLTHGDQQWIFTLGLDRVWGDDVPIRTVYTTYYGDFVINVDGPVDDNVLEGLINENVLNEKTITLNIADVSSLNSPSGIYYGSGYGGKTNLWRETNQYDTSTGNEQYSLAEWLLRDRFKLFGKNRKKISATIKTSDFLKPFTMFYDLNDPDKTKYILTNYKYSPTLQKYNIELWEYSDDEIILS